MTPIPDLRGFPRVLKKTLDLRSQVRLRGVQSLPPRRSQILLHDSHTLIRLQLGSGSFLCSKLGGNHRRFQLLGITTGIRGRWRIDAWPWWATLDGDQRNGKRWQFELQIRNRIFGNTTRLSGLHLNYRPDLHSRCPRDTRPFPHAASAQHARSAPDKHNSPTKRAPRQGIVRPRWNEWHLQAASGNSIRNVVPRPTSDVKSIEPLCSCTIRNALASPIPLPPGRVVKNN
jgi:hypothetical protein